jgi:hypothetical protein
MISACSCGAQTSIDKDWQLMKENEQYAIYARKLHNSKFKEIKVIGRIESSLSAIVMALEDIEYQKKWVLRTLEAYEVEKLGVGKYHFYISTDMPFPVSDRDLVCYYERTQDPITKVVTTKSYATPDLIPKKKSFVRIPSFHSYYTLKPAQEGWLDMEYFLKIDPGGALPAWVVNLAATTGPNSTMKSLYEVIETGKYDDVVVEGVVEP